jgi:hypothetical protein
MANILNVSEAANAVRTTTTDQVMLDLLPMVDKYIQMATGRDWSADTVIAPEAKSAARMLLVSWYENPSMITPVGAGGASLGFGLTAALIQLEALALRYRHFEGLNSAGGILLPGAKVGDTVTSVTGVVGVTGDQSAAFETVISVEDQIQQVSTSDLTEKFYRALLTPVEAR